MEVNAALMDNDSGYMSHNQESNLDSSVENVNSRLKSPVPLFVNEDTLLEKPQIAGDKQQQLNTSWGSCNKSFDSVITASESSNTNLSIFDDLDGSDGSVVIPYIKPIVIAADSQRALKPRTGVSPEKPATTKGVLGNVTNVCEQTTGNCANANKPTSFCDSLIRPPSCDKENTCPLYGTPAKTYKNPITAEISPDLFQDVEDPCEPPPTQCPSTSKERFAHSNDAKLLRSVQKGLSGVCPPPNVTCVQMSAAEMLERIHENSAMFCSTSTTITTKMDGGGPNERGGCLLVTGSLEECMGRKWPHVLEPRYHGLHYNRSKTSEEFEHLCTKYAERYVGCETQSTCTVFESNAMSPVKRKAIKPKWSVKSPGRRLSHLARRRITFSSANLQAGGSSLVGSRARQILVDVKKMSLLNKKKSPRKTPRKSPKKTPSKSPYKLRTNTPSSSAKKKLAQKFRKMVGELENMAPSTSSACMGIKRPLFDSPDKSSCSSSSTLTSAEKKSTKRELFPSTFHGSSPHSQWRSPFKGDAYDRKRKRTESDSSSSYHSNAKLSRTMSDLQPSQSQVRTTLNRTLSETVMPSSRVASSSAVSLTSRAGEEFSDIHKKKLQWAVYESLRQQNIHPNHEQFKAFATVLARVTRRILLSLSASGMRVEGRTTERMFRIAKFHSHAVVKGKSVEEIVDEYNRSRVKNQRPHGYVGVEEFNRSLSASLGGATSSTTRSNGRPVLQDRSNEKVTTSDSHSSRRSNQESLPRSRIDRIKKVISFDSNS